MLEEISTQYHTYIMHTLLNPNSIHIRCLFTWNGTRENLLTAVRVCCASPVVRPGSAHASLLAEVSHDEAGRERPLLAGKAHALFPHKIVAV